MFLTDRRSQQASSPTSLRALEVWRAAEQLVGERWHAFLDADADGRKWAFSVYAAALDSEEYAAADLATIVSCRGA